MPAITKLFKILNWIPLLGTLLGGGKSLKDDDYEAAFNNLVWMILKVADKKIGITPLRQEDAEKEQSNTKGGILGSLLGKNFS